MKENILGNTKNKYCLGIQPPTERLYACSQENTGQVHVGGLRVILSLVFGWLEHLLWRICIKFLWRGDFLRLMTPMPGAERAALHPPRGAVQMVGPRKGCHGNAHRPREALNFKQPAWPGFELHTFPCLVVLCITYLANMFFRSIKARSYIAPSCACGGYLRVKW